jgi:hypothetical protein
MLPIMVRVMLMAMLLATMSVMLPMSVNTRFLPLAMLFTRLTVTVTVVVMVFGL